MNREGFYKNIYSFKYERRDFSYLLVYKRKRKQPISHISYFSVVLCSSENV